MSEFKYHLGIDLHRLTSYWTLMDNDKNIIYRKNIKTSKESIDAALSEINLPAQSIQAAIEPVSQWGWYGDLLEQKGLTVKLVNVYKSKLIAESKLKYDKVDSRILADMLRSDFLPTAYLAPKETRELREFMRARSFFVRMRTRARNRIHNILAKHGIICPWTDMFGKQGQKWLKAQSIGSPYDEEIKSLLRVFDELTFHIEKRDNTCASMIKESRELEILTSIPGVGSITALMVMAEVGDFRRFRTSGQLASFAGLVSSSHSSGGKERLGNITHRGSVWLRTALVESTGKVSKKWGYLHDFYQRIREKKGNNIARVALARKVLTLAWHLVITNQKFNPYPSGSKDNVKTGSSALS